MRTIRGKTNSPLLSLGLLQLGRYNPERLAGGKHQTLVYVYMYMEPSQQIEGSKKCLEQEVIKPLDKVTRNLWKIGKTQGFGLSVVNDEVTRKIRVRLTRFVWTDFVAPDFLFLVIRVSSPLLAWEGTFRMGDLSSAFRAKKGQSVLLVPAVS